MTQLVTRVDDALVAQVDALVEAGVVANRSEAVRMALDRLVRAETGRRIAEAYRRQPQTEEELAGIDERTARMIAEEPW
jgi:Arc/MetJ-type ribon-helix-helix transcriptional regulator